MRWSPASAAVRTRSACSTRFSTTRRCDLRRRSGGRRHRERASTPPRCAPAVPACCTAIAPTSVRRRRPDHRDAFGFRRTRLSRRRPRACVAQGQRPRAVRRRHRRRSARGVPRADARSKASSPALESSHAVALCDEARARDGRRIKAILVNLSGPRRQGHPYGRRARRDQVLHVSRTRRRAFAHCERTGRARGADPVHHRRRSRAVTAPSR